MKRKILLGSLLGLMLSASAFAQHNLGTDYLDLGELELAKNYFTKAQEQSPAESLYFLGEIAYQEGNLDLASKDFQAGLAKDPMSALNEIGLAKLKLKTDPKGAKHDFDAAKKKAKKNVDVLLAIAKAYFDNGMTDDALLRLKDARKVDKKSPYTYMFEGDMLMKQHKPGEAAAQYDQAISFDPNCVLAYVKGANIYEVINSKTAIDMLNKALQIRPDYSIANKFLANLNYQNGFYPQAIAAFQAYFKDNNYTTKDITDFAAVQYFSKDYPAAFDLIKQGLAKDSNNFVLHRLLMYTNNEAKKYADGLMVGKTFFNLPINQKDTTNKYIVQDYMAYANILANSHDQKGALEQYKKIVSLDTTKIEVNKQVAEACANSNMSADAAAFFDKYVQLMKDKADAKDFFQLGRYYYIAGTDAAKDTLKEVKDQMPVYFANADSAFAVVAKRVPESPLGVLWQARTNAQLDPNTTKGLAKPYYEQLVKILATKTTDDAKIDLKEAYTYLSYFYYLQWDSKKTVDAKNSCQENAQKLLDIDPSNNVGQQLIGAVKQADAQAAKMAAKQAAKKAGVKPKVKTRAKVKK